jgi:hypothetical protein
VQTLDPVDEMKKRTYTLRLIPVNDDVSFDVPKDEKWRLLSVDAANRGNGKVELFVVFLTWKITEAEVAGIVWSCS